MNNQIEEFNKKLVDDKSQITIIDYVKKLNDLYFHIDINFIDDFTGLVDKEGFTISHEMLFKYNVLSETSDSYNVKRLLDQNELEVGVDYSHLEVVLDHSSKNKKIYYLTNDVFKMILMRKKDTKQFSKYFILLERAVKYYNDYQLLQLQEKMKNLCKDRTLELGNPDKKERFIIAFRNEALLRPYAVIRTQVMNVRRILTKIHCDESDILVNIPCCYANNLYNKIKEELHGHIMYEKRYLYIDEKGDCVESGYDPTSMENEYNHVSITRNIGIIDMTEEDFIHKIHEIDQMRFVH